MVVASLKVSRSDRNATLIRIGIEIRRRRQKLDIPQIALAAKAREFMSNVIGRTERGKYDPSVLTLDAIAAALNTSMVDLLRGAFR